MKSAISVVLLVCFILFGLASGANAGWGDLLKNTEQILTGTPPKDPQSPSPATPGDDEAQAIINDYIGYSEQMIEAQRLMCLAFGLKEEAAKLQVERQVLLSGNVSKSSIDKQRKVSAAAQEKIDQMLQEERMLSDEGKEHYVQSLQHYGVGVLKAIETSKKTESFCNQTAKALEKEEWLTGITKLLSAVGLAKIIVPIVPRDLKNSLTTLPRYFTYAKAKEIKIPEEAAQASDALGQLGPLVLNRTKGLGMTAAIL